LACVHAKHAHEATRRFGLPDVEEVGDKANWVAASGGLVRQRKVGPATVRQVYPERTGVAIAATGVKREVFVALAPAVGQQTLEDRGRERQRRPVDGGEVDVAARVITSCVRAMD
jgi:hypothetical protein